MLETVDNGQRRRDRMRELAVALAYVLLCGVALWTVVIAELTSDGHETADGPASVSRAAEADVVAASSDPAQPPAGRSGSVDPAQP